MSRTGSVGAMPHSHEASTNEKIEATNRRTWPKRCVSQPVSGMETALAAANTVMTHVPSSTETPMSPEMVGMATLAIDVSSTFMKVASETATVPRISFPPWSGGGGAGGDDEAAGWLKRVLRVFGLRHRIPAIVFFDRPPRSIPILGRVIGLANGFRVRSRGFT
jgi:hypothetical protein